MALSDLIAALLVAGFIHLKGEDENQSIYRVGGEYFHRHHAYEPIWRYPNIRPFDIGAVILKDKRVLVLYEDRIPNLEEWVLHRIFNDPKEAWGFIKDFLQEHP